MRGSIDGEHIHLTVHFESGLRPSSVELVCSPRAQNMHWRLMEQIDLRCTCEHDWLFVSVCLVIGWQSVQGLLRLLLVDSWGMLRNPFVRISGLKNGEMDGWMDA